MGFTLYDGHGAAHQMV